MNCVYQLKLVYSARMGTKNFFAIGKGGAMGFSRFEPIVSRFFRCAILLFISSSLEIIPESSRQHVRVFSS
jgi:hypothetical protein